MNKYLSMLNESNELCFDYYFDIHIIHVSCVYTNIIIIL